MNGLIAFRKQLNTHLIRILLCVGVVSAEICSTQASPIGSSLGINFGAGLTVGGDSTTMNGAAGLLGGNNWNNAVGNAGSDVTLVRDDDGTSIASDAKLTWSSNGATPLTTGTATNNDQRLMNSFLDSAYNTLGSANRPVIIVTNLDLVFTSGGYHVAIYINNQSGSIRGGQYGISDNKGYTNWWNTAITASPFSGNYIRDVTQNNLTVADETQGANYVLFTNLTGNSFKVTTIGINMTGLSNMKTPVAGVEIFPASGRPAVSRPLLSATSVFAGTPVSVSVQAWGGLPLSYQWQVGFNGGAFTNVSGLNDSAMVINTNLNASVGDYLYRVIVSNSFGSSTSAPSATLMVSQPIAPFPITATLPEMVTAYAGNEARFMATFGGTQPIVYQWKYTADKVNYADVPEATNATLVLSNLDVGNTGYYSLWASNVISGGFWVGSSNAQLNVLPGPAPAQLAVTNSVGVSVTVTSDGAYTVAYAPAGWTLSGTLGQPLFNLGLVSGSDQLGGYNEICLGYTNSTLHAAGIRLYTNATVVLFPDQTLGLGGNDLAFPNLLPSDTSLGHLGYSGIFANYTFGTPDADSPRIYYDTNFNTFILSAATNFMIAQSVVNGSGSIACGINSGIAQLPSGFTHSSILTLGQGINQTFDVWGAALTGLSGKHRPANDSAVELNKLGYWTDNGATYYYNFLPDLGYEGTLLAVRDAFASNGVPISYMQLDSWWYPKGVTNTWEGDPDNNRGGVSLYQADSTLFPNGLEAFHQQLGLPLITHCRWIDPSSPYTTEYSMSKNVVVDPAYWADRMTYLKNNGVMTYEQDWLNDMALPLMNLSDPPDFMNYMAAAAASNGVNMQYCMELPRHYLQSTLYDNLMTVRTCQDRFERSKWGPEIYASRLAYALGAWPWTDVFYSRETRNLLLSTLSAGAVGVGDAIASINVTNLLKAIRPDGVIVKPDVPLMPLDQTYVNDALGLGLPMVAAAYVNHGNMRAAYVFSYTRSSSSAHFAPGDLGFSSNVYVYDESHQLGTIVQSNSIYYFSTTASENTTGGSFFIVVPIGPSGVGFLGDMNKFVTLGKKRIPKFSDTGVIKATVAFALGETNVALTGYAAQAPYIRALDGSQTSVSFNADTHLFTLDVSLSASGNTVLALSQEPFPSLSINQVAGQCQVSWPAAAVGYTLETTTNLAAGAVWQPVSEPVTTIGNSNVVLIDVQEQSVFYRLQQ